MGNELERKYLIWQDGETFATKKFFELYKLNSIEEIMHQIKLDGLLYKQGYFDLDYGMELGKQLGANYKFDPTEARVRAKGANDYEFTIKGKGDLSRPEVPIEISELIFNQHWEQTKDKRVFKLRDTKPYMGFKSETDLYTDRKLILAEVEVQFEHQLNELIPLGKDVSKDSNYKNANLAK